MTNSIRHEADLLAHYPGAQLHAGELELGHVEPIVRVQWLPLILQVRVSSKILDAAPPHHAELVEAVNAANTEIGHAVFHLPNALFAKHLVFMEDDRSVSASVLDRSVALVGGAARRFAALFRGIAAGSGERLPSLEERTQALARAVVDALGGGDD